MTLRRVLPSFFFVLAVVACGGEATPSSSGLDGGPAPVVTNPDPTPSQSPCAPTSASTLPGVSVHFDKSVRCTFTLAEVARGVSFPYVVEVSAATARVAGTPTGNGCFAPDTRYGLSITGHIGAGDHRYCNCDYGLCQDRQLPPITLAPGTYPRTYPSYTSSDVDAALVWTGVSWNGPSDTSTGYGAPFPAGTYDVVVEASGTWQSSTVTTPFTVTATLPITLTP